jgi:ribosomal protein S18 acetylase RimI-like enzyme
MAGFAVRPIREDERDALVRRVHERWGSATVISGGRSHLVASLPSLVAADGDRWRGMALYRMAGGACELVLLEAFEPGEGVGTALLSAVADVARSAGARRLWLVTTNDNVEALRFYQRRGMHLVRVRAGAVDRARERLKPEIPLRGRHGIPLRDELEMELRFDRDAGRPSSLRDPQAGGR